MGNTTHLDPKLNSFGPLVSLLLTPNGPCDVTLQLLLAGMRHGTGKAPGQGHVDSNARLSAAIKGISFILDKRPSDRTYSSGLLD
jgi:hypothetical protein